VSPPVPATRNLPFAAARGGVRLAVRLVPKAKADRILGLAEEADGAVALKIAVHAPPQEGRANEALLRFLAQVLRVKRSDLTLVLGAADRRKLVHIAGEPAALMMRLEEELRTWLRRG